VVPQDHDRERRRQEAGGRVTDGSGRSLDVSQSTILATNGHIHRRLLAALAPRALGPRRT